MILATILSKTKSDSYLEGAATTELVEERALDHFGASLSSLDEVSPSVEYVSSINAGMYTCSLLDSSKPTVIREIDKDNIWICPGEYLWKLFV